MSYITQRGQGLLNTNKLCIQQPCRKRSEGRLKRYESCNDVRAMHADEYIRSVYLLGLVSNFKSLKNIAASYLLSNCNLGTCNATISNRLASYMTPPCGAPPDDCSRSCYPEDFCGNPCENPCGNPCETPCYQEIICLHSKITELDQCYKNQKCELAQTAKCLNDTAHERDMLKRQLEVFKGMNDVVCELINRAEKCEGRLKSALQDYQCLVSQKEQLCLQLDRLKCENQREVDCLKATIKQQNCLLCCKAEEVTSLKERVNNTCSTICMQSNDIKDLQVAVCKQNKKEEDLRSLISDISIELNEKNKELSICKQELSSLDSLRDDMSSIEIFFDISIGKILNNDNPVEADLRCKSRQLRAIDDILECSGPRFFNSISGAEENRVPNRRRLGYCEQQNVSLTVEQCSSTSDTNVKSKAVKSNSNSYLTNIRIDECLKNSDSAKPCDPDYDALEMVLKDILETVHEHKTTITCAYISEITDCKPCGSYEPECCERPEGIMDYLKRAVNEAVRIVYGDPPPSTCSCPPATYLTGPAEEDLSCTPCSTSRASPSVSFSDSQVCLVDCQKPPCAVPKCPEKPSPNKTKVCQCKSQQTTAVQGAGTSTMSDCMKIAKTNEILEHMLKDILEIVKNDTSACSSPKITDKLTGNAKNALKEVLLLLEPCQETCPRNICPSPQVDEPCIALNKKTTCTAICEKPLNIRICVPKETVKTKSCVQLPSCGRLKLDLPSKESCTNENENENTKMLMQLLSEMKKPAPITSTNSSKSCTCILEKSGLPCVPLSVVTEAANQYAVEASKKECPIKAPKTSCKPECPGMPRNEESIEKKICPLLTLTNNPCIVCPCKPTGTNADDPVNNSVVEADASPSDGTCDPECYALESFFKQLLDCMDQQNQNNQQKDGATCICNQQQTDNSCPSQPCPPQPCPSLPYPPLPCLPQPCFPKPCSPQPCSPQPCSPLPCSPKPCRPEPCPGSTFSISQAIKQAFNDIIRQSKPCSSASPQQIDPCLALTKKRTCPSPDQDDITVNMTICAREGTKKPSITVPLINSSTLQDSNRGTCPEDCEDDPKQMLLKLLTEIKRLGPCTAELPPSAKSRRKEEPCVSSNSSSRCPAVICTSPCFAISSCAPPPCAPPACPPPPCPPPPCPPPLYASPPCAQPSSDPAPSPPKPSIPKPRPPPSSDTLSFTPEPGASPSSMPPSSMPPSSVPPSSMPPPSMPPPSMPPPSMPPPSMPPPSMPPSCMPPPCMPPPCSPPPCMPPPCIPPPCSPPPCMPPPCMPPPCSPPPCPLQPCSLRPCAPQPICADDATSNLKQMIDEIKRALEMSNEQNKDCSKDCTGFVDSSFQPDSKEVKKDGDNDDEHSCPVLSLVDMPCITCPCKPRSETGGSGTGGSGTGGSGTGGAGTGGAGTNIKSTASNKSNKSNKHGTDGGDDNTEYSVKLKTTHVKNPSDEKFFSSSTYHLPYAEVSVKHKKNSNKSHDDDGKGGKGRKGKNDGNDGNGGNGGNGRNGGNNENDGKCGPCDPECFALEKSLRGILDCMSKKTSNSGAAVSCPKNAAPLEGIYESLQNALNEIEHIVMGAPKPCSTEGKGYETLTGTSTSAGGKQSKPPCTCSSKQTGSGSDSGSKDKSKSNAKPCRTKCDTVNTGADTGSGVGVGTGTGAGTGASTGGSTAARTGASTGGSTGASTGGSTGTRTGAPSSTVAGKGTPSRPSLTNVGDISIGKSTTNLEGQSITVLGGKSTTSFGGKSIGTITGKSATSLGGTKSKRTKSTITLTDHNSKDVASVSALTQKLGVPVIRVGGKSGISLANKSTGGKSSTSIKSHRKRSSSGSDVIKPMVAASKSNLKTAHDTSGNHPHILVDESNNKQSTFLVTSSPGTSYALRSYEPSEDPLDITNSKSNLNDKNKSKMKKKTKTLGLSKLETLSLPPANPTHTNMVVSDQANDKEKAQGKRKRITKTSVHTALLETDAKDPMSLTQKSLASCDINTLGYSKLKDTSLKVEFEKPKANNWYALDDAYINPQMDVVVSPSDQSTHLGINPMHVADALQSLIDSEVKHQYAPYDNIGYTYRSRSSGISSIPEVTSKESLSETDLSIKYTSSNKIAPLTTPTKSINRNTASEPSISRTLRIQSQHNTNYKVVPQKKSHSKSKHSSKLGITSETHRLDSKPPTPKKSKSSKLGNDFNLISSTTKSNLHAKASNHSNRSRKASNQHSPGQSSSRNTNHQQHHQRKSTNSASANKSLNFVTQPLSKSSKKISTNVKVSKPSTPVQKIKIECEAPLHPKLFDSKYVKGTVPKIFYTSSVEDVATEYNINSLPSGKEDKTTNVATRKNVGTYVAPKRVNPEEKHSQPDNSSASNNISYILQHVSIPPTLFNPESKFAATAFSHYNNEPIPVEPSHSQVDVLYARNMSDPIQNKPSAPLPPPPSPPPSQSPSFPSYELDDRQITNINYKEMNSLIDSFNINCVYKFHDLPLTTPNHIFQSKDIDEMHEPSNPFSERGDSLTQIAVNRDKMIYKADSRPMSVKCIFEKERSVSKSHTTEVYNESSTSAEMCGSEPKWIKDNGLSESIVHKRKTFEANYKTEPVIDMCSLQPGSLFPTHSSFRSEQSRNRTEQKYSAIHQTKYTKGSASRNVEVKKMKPMVIDQQLLDTIQMFMPSPYYEPPSPKKDKIMLHDIPHSPKKSNTSVIPSSMRKAYKKVRVTSAPGTQRSRILIRSSVYENESPGRLIKNPSRGMSSRTAPKHGIKLKSTKKCRRLSPNTTEQKMKGMALRTDSSIQPKPFAEQISSKDLDKMCLPKKSKKTSKRSSSLQSSSGVSSVKNKSTRSQEYSSKDSDTNNDKWMFGKCILTKQLSTEQKIMQLGSQIDADKTVISQLAKNLRMRNLARKKLLSEKKKLPNYKYSSNSPSEQRLQDPIETLTTYKVNYMLRCANAVRCKKQQPSEYKRN